MTHLRHLQIDAVAAGGRLVAVLLGIGAGEAGVSRVAIHGVGGVGVVGVQKLLLAIIGCIGPAARGAAVDLASPLLWSSDVVVLTRVGGCPEAGEGEEGGDDDWHDALQLSARKNPVGKDAEDDCRKVSSSEGEVGREDVPGMSKV